MKVFRYEFPVDDQWHEFPVDWEQVLSVDRVYPGVVEFWALVDDTKPSKCELRAFGTGQPLPKSEMDDDDGTDKQYGYAGTAIWEESFAPRLVWHVFTRRVR